MFVKNKEKFICFLKTRRYGLPIFPANFDRKDNKKEVQKTLNFESSLIDAATHVEKNKKNFPELRVVA